ncbi:hypothetical protein C2S51_025793 [Perilla frutescens var. frutescens]|nr:hypothetical protein C2S51_025793 [Perilla frutescens var. frutescens]
MSPNEATEDSGELVKCEKLDRVASWFGATVATAFFTSLERCSCITLSTSNDEEAKDRPLMLTERPCSATDAANKIPSSAPL